MKTFLKTYRNDILLITAVLLAAVIAVFLPGFFRKSGAVAEISVNGTVVGSLDLSVDQTFRVESPEGGFNVITVENGAVFVSEADCRDGICKKRGKIGSIGETIVCLPHKTVVTVRAGESGK